MPFQSIPDQFLSLARTHPDDIGYAVRRDGAWITTSWAQYAVEVRTLARGLIALDCSAGTTVGIIGFNCPSWTISDLAAMTAGCVPVGVYTSCSPAQVRYILNHAEARVVIVADEEAFRKIRAEHGNMPTLKHVVLMRQAGQMRETMGPDAPRVWSWEAMLSLGREVAEEDLDARTAAIESNTLGALIYTSGTTGPPKGSMLSHGNMAMAGEMGEEMVPGDLHGARHVSYLPLAHAAERGLTLIGAVTRGYAVYYAESVEQMGESLREVQPDLFLGVPRVWEKMHAGLDRKFQNAGWAQRMLLAWARRIALDVNEERCHGEEPKGWTALQFRLARKLVLSPLHRAIGFGRNQVCLSGAAPLSTEQLRFFASIDLPIFEVYGQTEDCGPSTLNRLHCARWGSVGRPFINTEVCVAEDGEVMVRGRHVFLGYYKDPEATALVLRDGWLYSGDLGRYDSEGFMHITGRKKEILITAGGKNVAPRNIEEGIATHPDIAEVIVIGDRRKFLSALITLVDYDADGGQRHRDPKILRGIWQHVQSVNERLSGAESIKRVAVLDRPFLESEGEVTPTMKLKRPVIADHFATEIDVLYGEHPVESTTAGIADDRIFA